MLRYALVLLPSVCLAGQPVPPQMTGTAPPMPAWMNGPGPAAPAFMSDTRPVPGAPFMNVRRPAVVQPNIPMAPIYSNQLPAQPGIIHNGNVFKGGTIEIR